jgi:uncharacterized protein (DUF427 family)
MVGSFFVRHCSFGSCAIPRKAHYHTLLVDGKENADAAWYYPEPKPAAQKIAGKVAFWRGVRIEA